MTGTEYQELAMRTCSIPYNDKEAMLNHALLGLTSEAGEAAGILQKTYQGYPEGFQAEKSLHRSPGDI